MTTITIKSSDTNLINSILYLLKGNKNSEIKVEDIDSDTLLFEKLDAHTQQIVNDGIADYRNGNFHKFKSFNEVFSDGSIEKRFFFVERCGQNGFGGKPKLGS
jgi:hypothetical protein